MKTTHTSTYVYQALDIKSLSLASSLDKFTNIMAYDLWNLYLNDCHPPTVSAPHHSFIHLKVDHDFDLDCKSGVYKCASTKCKHPVVIWSRFEDFKLHIIQMHAGEDLNDLIAK